MRKLRILIMEGSNETFVQSCFGKHFSQLKWVDISSHVTQLPESMWHLVGLIILQLQNCQNLLFIPEFLKNMTLLMHLNFYKCSLLNSLPTTIGDLKHLTKLLFQGCENLKELLETIRNIFSLSILDLSCCKSIESLPTTIVGLKNLTKLKLRQCANLKELLETIGSIFSLSIWIYLGASPLNHC